MTFAIKGNTEVPKKELKHKIERLGGTVVENMDKTTTACVSTKGAESWCDEANASFVVAEDGRKLCTQY